MDQEIKYTINKFEGGYNDIPNDKGGPTNWGISQRSYPSVDIQHLTLDEAVKIYERDFYLPLLLDQVANVQVRWKIFDIAVQRGPIKAAMIVQGVLGVQQDGKMGPQTLSRLNAGHPTDLLYRLSYAQLDAYIDRVVKVPSQLVFLRGWANRAMDLGEELVTT